MIELRTRRLVLIPAASAAGSAVRAAGGRLRPAIVPAWVMFEFLHDGSRIGEGGLLFQEAVSTEIGYRIDPPHRRQGFATEGLSAIVRHAFRDWDLDGLGAETAADNIASQRTLVRLGFRDTGGRAERWSDRLKQYVTYHIYHLERPAAERQA